MINVLTKVIPYLRAISSYCKNNIVIAAGNNADKGKHKSLYINSNSKSKDVQFYVGNNEKFINIDLWSDSCDDFYIYLVSPSGKKTQRISLKSGTVKNIISQTKIKGFTPLSSYSQPCKLLKIQLISNDHVLPGIWKLNFATKDITNGNVNLYISGIDTLNSNTRFINPSKELTITVPGTAKYPITVGSFNPCSNLVSSFSGQGDIKDLIYKPDLLCPGEYIQ